MRILLTVFALGSALAAAQFTDEAIDAAIAGGLAGSLTGVVDVGSNEPGQFRVQIAGPLGRIAAAAREAKLNGDPFTRAQVTPGMLTPGTIQIAIHPNDPEFTLSRTRSTPPAERVLLQTRSGRTRPTVDAVHTETYKIAWSNGVGARLDGQGLIAQFDRAALPAGEFDVVVQTTGKELRYTVRPADLERLR